jgi:hypothetical protein
MCQIYCEGSCKEIFGDHKGEVKEETLLIKLRDVYIKENFNLCDNGRLIYKDRIISHEKTI